MKMSVPVLLVILMATASFCRTTPEGDWRAAPQESKLDPARKKKAIHLRLRTANFPAELKEYTSLRILHLYGLTENPPSALGEMKSLRILAFHESAFAQLPSAVLALPELEELIVDSSALITLPAGLSAMKPLRKLDIRANQLAEIDPQLWQGREVSLRPKQFPGGRVKVSLLPVRDRPELTGRGVGTLRQSDHVYVLKRTGKTMALQGQSGEWLFVWPADCRSPCTRMGYVFSAFLE